MGSRFARELAAAASQAAASSQQPQVMVNIHTDKGAVEFIVRKNTMAIKPETVLVPFALVKLVYHQLLGLELGPMLQQVQNVPDAPRALDIPAREFRAGDSATPDDSCPGLSLTSDPKPH